MGTTQVLKMNDDVTINLGLIDLEGMRARAAGAGFEIGGDLSLKKAVKKLADHFLDTVPGGDGGNLATCKHCGGPIDCDVDPCPFCGLADDAPTAAEAAQANGKHEIEDPASLEEQAAKASAGAPERDAKAAKRAAKRAASALATRPTTQAIVSATEKKLDAAVGEIKKLQAGAAFASWRLGHAYAEIMRDDLWKSRTKDDGKVAYKDFDQFVKVETGVPGRYARLLVDSFKKFTEVQMQALGVKKMFLLLPAPEGKRDELAAKAATQTSAQVRAAVTEAREEAKARTGKLPTRSEGRESDKRRDAKATGKAGTKAKKPRKGEMVIAQVKHGVPYVINLFEDGDPKRPATMKSLASKKVKVVTGVVDSESKVRFEVELVERKGGPLRVVLVGKRIS